MQTILGTADMQGEIAEAEETTAIPVSEKVFAAMRRNNAGILIVSVDERYKDGAGNFTLNPNVMIESLGPSNNFLYTTPAQGDLPGVAPSALIWLQCL